MLTEWQRRRIAHIKQFMAWHVILTSQVVAAKSIISQFEENGNVSDEQFKYLEGIFKFGFENE